MRLRDWIAPLGILFGALGVAGVAAAASSSSKTDDKKKSGDGKTATVTRRVKKGGVHTLEHTGLDDSQAWMKSRFATSVAYLTGLGLDDQTARKMSLSALAHWAIETGSGDITTAGSHEYNYNVGGIHARDGDAYFDSTDAGVKTKFASYDSAEDGIADYWALLAADYSSCLKQMKDDPTSDAWIRCLGQKGYYGGSVETMASGWKIRRAELAKGDTGIHGDDNIGDDAARTFGPYSQDAMNELLTKVRGTGMNITGNNPWTLDPGQHGIKLEASYDHDSGNLGVKVLSKNFYVTNAQIWSKLAPLMPAGDRVFGDIDDERDE